MIDILSPEAISRMNRSAGQMGPTSIFEINFRDGALGYLG